MASPSPASSSQLTQPPQYRAIGVCLAVGSGVLIGSSFVFKKKGLLRSQEGRIAGEGVAYLKSPMWWFGMIIMILGEICNFAAYAFVEAIIVTPMGALSVVISALLSHFILGERLSLFGWIACVQCLIGSSILALNGPEEQSVNTIDGFQELFVTPWFLSYAGVVVLASIILAVWIAPKYGHKTMLPYIAICSLIGGISVSCTQGLGACILTSIRGHNQFKHWFIYFLMILVVITLLTEIYYLNVALAKYNTAMVTPTYYVTFTFCTLLTSIILYQGLKASVTQIVTIVLAFLVICTGIFILQMSKVDPRKLSKVDEHTSLLLEAARSEVDPHAVRNASLRRASSLRSRTSRPGMRSRTTSGPSTHSVSDGAPQLYLPNHPMSEIDPDEVLDLSFDDIESTREIVEKSEEPGIDALRGTFGALGTLVRAKRRARVLSAASSQRSLSDDGHSHGHGHGASPSSATGRGSTANTRPSWLAGHLTSAKGSLFRPMHDILDAEKGQAEMVETTREKGEVGPRSASPIRTSTSIPLALRHPPPSTATGSPSQESDASFEHEKEECVQTEVRLVGSKSEDSGRTL